MPVVIMGMNKNRTTRTDKGCRQCLSTHHTRGVCIHMAAHQISKEHPGFHLGGPEPDCTVP
jgi:hypothetical protein